MSDRRDLNFLFAVFALKNDFIERDSFRKVIAGLVDWPEKSVGDSLVQSQEMSADEKSIVEQIVDRYLQKHGGDVSAGLAALQDSNFFQHDLVRTVVNDARVAQSVKLVGGGSLFETMIQQATSQAAPGELTEPQTAAEQSSQIGDPARQDPTMHKRFASIKIHAKGGLGEIYVARDLELNREVALKEMQERFADDLSSRRRFVMEGEVTGSLEHPGVVPVYGMGADQNGRPFYAMRFIRGESLSQAIESFHARGAHDGLENRRILALQKLLRRFIDVCNTLHYAHSRGVLHRDLKPDNIMLGPYGETLVVDWGLAKIIGRSDEIRAESTEQTLQPDTNSSPDKTRTGNVVGTLQYMSPEQALGWHDQLTPASDVFSLGAILYKMLTGQAIYYGQNIKELHQQAIECQIPPARQVDRHIPPPLDAICKKALHKRNSERYQSARDLAEDIESFLGDEPVSAWREPISVKARRWMRRHIAFVTAAVAVLVMGLVGSAAVLGLLSIKNREVAQQRDAAEKNWQAARQAVHKSLVLMSEDPRLKNEALEDFRLEMLQAAEPYYADFLAQQPDDPQLKFEQAEWRLTIAGILFGIDARRETIDQLNQAHGILATLVDKFPENDSYLSLYSKAEKGLGIAYYDLGEYEKSIEHYRSAIAAAESMSSSMDGVQESSLVASYDNLGQVYLTLADHEAADQAFASSASIQQQAIGVYPNDVWLNLSSPEFNRASLYARQGEVTKALTGYAAAIDRLSEASLDQVHHDRWQVQLASQYLEFANYCQDIGRPKQAYELWGMAQTHIEPLAKQHPGNADYQELLADIKTNQSLPGDTKRTDQASETLQVLKSNLANRVKIALQDPDVVRSQYAEARSHLILAYHFSTQNLPDQTNAECEAGLSIVNQLIERLNWSPSVKLLKSNLLQSQAASFLAKHDLEMARTNCELAVQLARETFEQTAEIEAATTLVRAYLGVMSIALRQKEFDQALTSLDDAQKLVEGLPVSYRAAPQYEDWIANLHQNRVDVYSGMGENKKSLAEIELALERRKNLVKQFPEEPIYSSRLSFLHAYLGFSLAKSLDVSLIDRVAEQLQASVDALANTDLLWINTQVLDAALQGQQLLIEEFDQNQDLQLKLTRLQKMIEYANILEERTGDVKYLIVNSQAETEISQIHSKWKDYVETQAAYERSLAAVEKALLKQPGNQAARTQRSATYMNLGQLLHLQDKPEEAFEAFSMAVEFGTKETQRLARLSRAIVGANLGNYQTAIEQTNEILKQSNVRGVEFYNAACVFSQAYAQAEKDDSLDQEIRDKMRMRYVEQAIELLERARAEGIYQSKESVEYLQTDKDFAPIRDRPEFKKLIDELVQSLQ